MITILLEKSQKPVCDRKLGFAKGTILSMEQQIRTVKKANSVDQYQNYLQVFGQDHAQQYIYSLYLTQTRAHITNSVTLLEKAYKFAGEGRMEGIAKTTKYKGNEFQVQPLNCVCWKRKEGGRQDFNLQYSKQIKQCRY